MAALVTRKNMFFIEPYRSIIALLNEFPDRGLTLKEIQYAIMKEHYLKYISTEMHTLLDNKIERLERLTLLKKYQMKIIKRKLKRSATVKKNKVYVIRNNLLQVLNRLIRQRTNAIFIEKKSKNTRKVYYKLRKEIWNEWIRQRNIDAFSSYPCEQMYHVPFNPEPEIEIQKFVSRVLYGFTEEIYKKLEKNDKEKFLDFLYTIEASLEKLEEIRYNSLMKEWNKRVDRYVAKIKSSAVKTALHENGGVLMIFMRDALFNNRTMLGFKNNLQDRTGLFIYDEIKNVSKLVFFRAMGWIFPVPGFEKSVDRPMFVNAFKSNELDEFVNDYYTFSKKVTGKNITSMSKTEKEKYLEIWSKEAFTTDYKLTKKDLLGLLEWCWENRDVVYGYWPYPLSFSRYYDTDKVLDYYQENV